MHAALGGRCNNAGVFMSNCRVLLTKFSRDCCLISPTRRPLPGAVVDTVVDTASCYKPPASSRASL